MKNRMLEIYFKHPNLFDMRNSKFDGKRFESDYKIFSVIKRTYAHNGFESITEAGNVRIT